MIFCMVMITTLLPTYNVPEKTNTKSDITYHIRATSNFDESLLLYLSSAIEKYYKFSVIVDKPMVFNNSLLIGKDRYDANKILRTYPKTHNTILLTASDIAYDRDKNGYAEWGIFGLGDTPGKTCLVSTFRLGKANVSTDTFKRRFVVIALHEIGHNLGLSHCKNNGCFMEAAKGKISTVDRVSNSLCSDCSRKINR